MGNRSPRHLRPGDRNLKGRTVKTVCPCCDPIINHRPKMIITQHRREIEDAIRALADKPEGAA